MHAWDMGASDVQLLRTECDESLIRSVEIVISLWVGGLVSEGFWQWAILGSVNDCEVLNVKRADVDLEGVKADTDRIHLLGRLCVRRVESTNAGPDHRKLAAETVLFVY